MPFIRVRGASVGDPLHEFDVTVGEAERHPDLYEVLDPEPVSVARAATFVPGVVPEPKKPKPPARRRKPKNPSGRTSTTTAPPGATPEEQA